MLEFKKILQKSSTIKNKIRVINLNRKHKGEPNLKKLPKPKMIMNNINRFQNLKIAFKINSLVLIMALFMGGIGFTGYVYYYKQNSDFNKMNKGSISAVKLLNEASAEIRKTEALSIEILLAPIDEIRKQEIQKSLKDSDDTIDTSLKDYASLIHSTDEAAKLPILREALNSYRSERQKSLEIGFQGNKLEAYRYYSNNALTDLDTIHIVLANLIDYNNSLVGKTINQNNKDFLLAGKILLILPIVAVLLSLLLGLFLARCLAKPMQAMLKSVQEVESGNLASKEQLVHSTDEIGRLAAAFDRMRSTLGNLVGEVSRSSRLVTESAEELQSITTESSLASEQIVATMAAAATDTETQALIINDASVAIQQVSASTQQIAATSILVADLTEKTSATTKGGQQAIDKVVNQMAVIGERTVEIQKTIDNLTLSNEQISDITKFISDIAAQTNLLALNAAIEAARAGEHGRSFTVVADEVRKLADQSQEASQQISSLIQNNHEYIISAVSAMNGALNDVEEGIKVVEIAGQAFSTNFEHTEEVSSQVREISSSIQQVAQGNEQIVDSINNISNFSKVTAERVQSVTDTIEEQAATQHQMAEASQNLTSIAQKLETAIQEFNVD